jgi:hypothetical protein
MNPKVPIFVSMVLILYSCIVTFDLNFCVITLSAVYLANALARVTSLETKLKTTSKALKEADAAKASADKAVKAAEARAIKAEKALAEVSQKQAKHEEGVVKRLDDILTSVDSKYFSCSYLLLISLYLSLCHSFLTSCALCDTAEQLGEIMKLSLDNPKDPLLDTVGVLESNWRNVRNILQRTCHVLPRFGLFPKKKKEMLVGNLRNLVEAFDTLEDPVLQLKLSSVRRGVEGTIALTRSHGENVDWEKVSSAYARRPEEMKEFFVEAKKYAPNLVSSILPAPTPLAPVPSLSAPTPMDPSPTKVA